MMSDKSEAGSVPVYLFQDPRFSPAGNTWVSAAPLDAVVSAYGGGGIKNTDGLSAAFGGAAVYQDDKTKKLYLGVWGGPKGFQISQHSEVGRAGR